MDQPPRAGAERAGSPFRPLTVLIVDDDPTLLRALASVLTPLADRVRTAGDAESALAALEAEGVDAVLVDVGLPTMSGIELGGAILRRWPDLEGRVAVMTGGPSIPQGPELQRYVTFRKPFHPGQIVDWLDGLRR